MSDVASGLRFSPSTGDNVSSPEVTVLLPVYNGAPYLEETLESILAQTFTNFELLVIDDGSTDGSRGILERFAARDARVRLVSRENRGLIATLNQGLALSRADIIARMDADDIALPRRFERQVGFMKSHPGVDVCGTALVFHETGEEKYLPEESAALQALTLFNTPVFHPTVIMRKASVLAVGGYASTAPCAEDYDLWERMLRAGSRFANLREVLLRYRVHPEMNRAKYYAKMTATSLKICARQLARLGLPADGTALTLHRICCAPCPETPAMRARLVNWLDCIEKANRALGVYSQTALQREIDLRKQALSPLRPLQQPSRWAIRQLRHYVHWLLSSPIGCRFPDLEGWLASCWWEIRSLCSMKNNRTR